MRRVLSVACAVTVCFVATGMAQQAAPPASTAAVRLNAPPADSTGGDRLPIKRVVLYKNGVGFFEHLGRVRGTQQVSIDFTSGQLNDVLKSLTTVDLGNGKVTGVSFNSDDPANRKLGTLSLPLDEETSALAFLGALRGARVEVQAGAGPVTGRVLAVEQRMQGEGDRQVAVRELALVTDGGELRTFDVTPKLSVRVLEGDVRGDVRRYLDIVASTRQRDLRRMTIASAGTGERQLYVSYISEVPVWKSTYRLVLPAKSGDAPLLQGWAIVDNTIGEDWTGVELSLVAGSPQSFIQQLSQPFYVRRPTVALPSGVQLTPQTHEATLLMEKSEAVTAPSEDAAPAPRQRMAMPGMAGGVVGGVVGGLPMAPPPPPPPSELAAEAMSRVEAAAQGRELGDLFEYRLKEPVTIRKNQSALVPIINAQVQAERVSVWNAAAGQRPRSAVWLTNATPNTLDGGAVAVLEAGTFTGEGLIDAVKPGERRLLSYAADLALLVDVKQDPAGPERVSSLRIARGLMMLKRELREKRTYTVRNEDSKPRTLVVEHPNRAGWTLTSAVKPDETAPGVLRFRLQAPPKATASLTVEETRTLDSSYQVANLTDDQLTMVVRQRALTPEAEQALRAVVAKKGEIAAVSREITDRQRETERIFQDQERLRENLKALKGSAEEKNLVTRYTRQLDEQETRLDAIRRESAERESKRAKLQAELEAMVGALTIG
jgi:hypothetical protein